MKFTQHQADVAIVGGGIVGGAAALSLAKRGLSVLLLERDYYGSHSSGINFGAVRRQGRPLSQMALAARANEIWAQLPDVIGTNGGFTRSGHLAIARNEIELSLLEAYRDRTRGHLDLQMLRKEEIRQRYPWLGPKVIGASLCKDDGHANPKLVSQAFARAAAAAGAIVRERTRVDDMLHDGNGFILTSTEGRIEIRSKYLLNCAGAWAGVIAMRFGETVPMTSGRPLMAVTEPLGSVMNASIAHEAGGLYARQAPQGHCIVGRARNFGLDEEAGKPVTERVTSMMKRAIDLVPALKSIRVMRTWSGTEGYLPDNDPVIGLSSTTPGLIHGFGFAGAGFLLGPAVGAVLAELVADGKSDTPIDAYAIGRFVQDKRNAGEASRTGDASRTGHASNVKDPLRFLRPGASIAGRSFAPR